MSTINLGIRGFVDLLTGHPEPERVLIVGATYADARAVFDELVDAFDEIEVERVIRTRDRCSFDLFDRGSVSTASLHGGSIRGQSADVVVLTRGAQGWGDTARMLVAPVVDGGASVAEL